MPCSPVAVNVLIIHRYRAVVKGSETSLLFFACKFGLSLKKSGNLRQVYIRA